jgi:hypothetical protein
VLAMAVRRNARHVHMPGITSLRALQREADGVGAILNRIQPFPYLGVPGSAQRRVHVRWCG